MSLGELNESLDSFMSNLYQEVSTTASEFNVAGDLMAGANIAGFMKVAQAALRQGAV